MPEDHTPLEATLTLQNQRGLHARASAKFVKCVEQFADTMITVEKDGVTVSGLSIMGLMMLAAAHGTQIHVKATGGQAEAALSALTELLGNKFNEET
ncbi:MAG: HPr family phosphocarrier protein [Pseudomonadota bacterium]